MKASNLQELYISELRDLYSAETQLTEALPKMAKAASHSHLKDAFTSHLKETRGQIERLEMIFTKLGVSPKGKTCKAMQGLITEGEEMIKETEEATRDAGLISAAQRVEHYEMAGYGTVRTYANQLGDRDAEKLLQMTLDEEGKADKKLTALAESVCNLEAAHAH
ncbi:MAG: ferritin-like domain-containing protein [Roseiflexaceae bacterium]|nr:ferritin-like domain-containing protein [Roseiflexaceae bacterium]